MERQKLDIVDAVSLAQQNVNDKRHITVRTFP
jgi:hypothetical protein